MPLFDAYVAVDWSASKTRRSGKDSIWLAALDGRGIHGPENAPTRAAATARVRDLLVAYATRRLRVLVGFDFPYGYPAGTAAAVSAGGGALWRRTWDALAELVVDDDTNANNRLHVAIELNRRLGTPRLWGSGSPDLSPTRPRTETLADWRAVERTLRAHRSYPKAVWQISYAGSVGSQALLGIPRVRELRDDPALRDISVVWPFETGLRAPDTTIARVVHAEIYPALFAVDRSAHAIPDARQVLAVVTILAALDREDGLAPLFAGQPTLSSSEREDAEAEEGWILGAPQLLANRESPDAAARHTFGTETTQTRARSCATLFAGGAAAPLGALRPQGKGGHASKARAPSLFGADERPLGVLGHATEDGHARAEHHPSWSAATSDPWGGLAATGRRHAAGARRAEADGPSQWRGAGRSPR